MFERENLIGVALLALCTVVGGILVYAITTGVRFRYTGPEWLAWVLAILFIGGSIYGVVASGRFRGKGRWPEPPGRRWPWQRRDEDR